MKKRFPLNLEMTEPLLFRSPLPSIGQEDLFLPHLSQEIRDLFCLNPVHVANSLYYQGIQELHGKLGFPTPSSHYTKPLGACLAARCFESLQPWLDSFSGGDTQEPFVIVEMGGGEGRLLEEVLRQLDLMISAYSRKEGGDLRKIKQHIIIAPLDQSSLLLDKQRTNAEKFGFTVLETHPVDLGTAFTEVPTWLATICGKVNFVFTCELLDDLSGGDIYFCKNQQWFRYKTLYSFPESKRPKDYPTQGFAQLHDVLKTDELDLMGPHYLLTFEQLMSLFSKIRKTEGYRPYYTTITVHEACTPPELLIPPKATESYENQLLYINTLAGFEKNCQVLCHPNADMVHMDYFKCDHTSRIGFFPEGQYYEISECWDKIVNQLLTPILQQPTVHVCMPQACASLSQWHLKECKESHFQNVLQVYTELGIPLGFNPEEGICMATHTLIARAKES